MLFPKVGELDTLEPRPFREKTTVGVKARVGRGTAVRLVLGVAGSGANKWLRIATAAMS